MYTECPSCETFFKITPKQLKAAGGKVRCGNCDNVFSALDGLVDIVPEDAVKQPSSDQLDESLSQSVFESAASEVSAESDIASEDAESEEASIAATTSTASIKSEIAEGADLPASGIAGENVEENTGQQEELMSLTDLEIPTTSADGEAEAKLAVEKEEINQDIDAALDGLFDGDTEMAQSVPATEIKPEPVSELSSISELDELQDLDFGNIGEAEKANSPTTAEGLGDVLTPSQSETSTLSEFEKELGQSSVLESVPESVSASLPDSAPESTSLKSEALDESNFDLGSSFLESEALTDESKTDARPKNTDDVVTSVDSYVLEELEASQNTSGGRFAKVAWVSVILLLLVVLSGQFAYLKRQDLAMYPDVKPVIESLCTYLNKVYPCEITPAADVAAIELLERNVVSHPNAENALLITSTIENKAGFDQAFPELVLTFSDINQKIMAKRTFSPAEYLSKEVDIVAGMKQDVPVKIMLEIVDPGEEAVNFEFNFQ